MAATRRRILARAALGLLVGLLSPGALWARERARAIHRATRNTLAGAIGVRLRSLLGRPRRSKPYEGRGRVELPEPAREPALALAEALGAYAPAPGFSGKPVDRKTLARLLHAANGVTGSGPGGLDLRAAPSAGALYAGEVYVAAERVEGLEPGVYAYAPLEGPADRGRLVRLRAGGELAHVAGALETPARARGAAAAVLLTNVFHRYRWRYANRGYRYALVDSGHIGENLRLAATSAGLAEWGPLRFRDERLNALLGVDGVDEAVCALHLLGARGDAPASSERRPLVEAQRAGRALPEAADDAPERYHARTRLVPAEGEGAGARGAADDGGEPTPQSEEEAASGTRSGGALEGNDDASGDAASGSSGRRLPARAAPSARVEAAIAERRSARAFVEQPIAAADLGFVLEAAVGHPALRRSPGVSLLVFVHRAEGLAPGLYEARPEARRLVPLREEALAEALVDVCLGQEKAGSAAAGLAMVGDLEAATARGGDRAYRDLLLESGAIGQRVYLAAEAAGLAARNLAAFLDDRMNALCGLDGRRRAVLHLTMLGPGD